MALNTQELQLVLRNLPSATRKAYSEGSVTDDQLERFAVSLGIKKQTADFSGVTSSSSSTASGGDREGSSNKAVQNLGSLADKAQAGLQSFAAGQQQLALDAAATQERVNQEQAALPWYRKDLLEAAGYSKAERANQSGSIATVLSDLADRPGEVFTRDYWSNPDAIQESQARNLTNRQANEASAQKVLDETGFGRAGLQALQDFAGTPSSAASVFGGLAAAIPAADAYSREYLEARLGGVDPKLADERARTMAGIEMGISAIPAAKFIPGLSRLGTSAVRGAATNALIRTGKTVLGEGTEEAATTLAQLGTEKLISDNSNDEALARFSAANLPENSAAMTDQVWRSFLAGAVGGGVVGTPQAVLQTASERGAAAGRMLQTNDRIRASLASNRQSLDRPRSGEIAPIDVDLFGMPLQGAVTTQEAMPVNEVVAQPEAAREPQPLTQEQRELMGKERARLREIAYLNKEKADLVKNSSAYTIGGDLSRSREIDDTLSRLETQALDPAALEAAGVVVRPLIEDMPEQPTAPLFKGDGTDATGPIQTRNPDAYYAPDGRLRSKEVDSNLEESNKALAAAEKRIQDNAKKAYGSARTKARSQAVQEAANLPEAERPLFVAQRLNEWQKSNSVESFIRTPAPQARTNRASVGVAQEVQVPEEVPVSPGLGVDALRAAAGADTTLAQQASTGPKTTTNSSQVLQTIKQRMGRDSGAQLSKLIGDGNLVIVDDVSEVPGNADEGGAGFYDGNRTYVVANRIPEGNVMGELLNVAAHELKHGADIGAGRKLKATIGEFIGNDANEQINRKIEALASSGNREALAAVEAARAGPDASTYALELPAYFINVSRNQRDAKGPAARLTGNIVSAVRTAYKRSKGDADISLDDVAYLSDRLIQKTAESGEALQGDVKNPLPLIYDRTATGFKDADKRGLTYKSADGVQKFIRSDAGAIMQPDGAYRLSKGRNVSLKDIMQHDELFAQIPEAADIQVFQESNGRAFGTYDPNTKEIALAPDVINGKAGVTMKQALIHELQHWIQDRHTTRGENFYEDTDKTPEELNAGREYTERSRNLDKAERTYLDALAAGIRRISNSNVKGAASAVVFDRNLKDGAKIREITALMEDAEVDTSFADTARAKYDAVRQSYNEAVPVYNAYKDKAYKQNITEQEAFFSQNRADYPQDAFPINPEETFIEETGRVRGKGGQVLAYNPQFLQEAVKKIKSPDNVAIRKLKEGFASFGSLGRDIAVMKENADGFAAVNSHHAMNVFNQLNRGIELQAKMGVNSGKYKTLEEGTAAIDVLIKDRMEALNNASSEQDRRSLMAAFVRTNPELKALSKGLDRTAQLSKTLLSQLIEANPNPTPDELKLMNTILDNSYKYTTNIYAAFQGESGRERSAQLRKYYIKGRSAIEKGTAIPVKYKDGFNTYNNAIKYLADNDLSIPDNNVLEATSTDRLSHLHTTWVGDTQRLRERTKAEALRQGMTNAEADQAVRQTLIDDLNTRAPDVSSEDVQGKARDLIDGMLGLTESSSPFASYYAGFKQDRSILESRTGLPKEIKELFGEIKDPAARLAVTIAKQGELAGRTRMLLDMKTQGAGKYLIPEQDAGLPGNERMTSVLSGENFGPLAGYRTTPEIAASISDSLEMFSSTTAALSQAYLNSEPLVNAAVRDGMKVVTSLAAKQKLLTVVADVYNLATNFIGSPLVLVANGITNPKAVANGLKTGAEVIWDTATAGRIDLSPAFEDAVRYGILDSARVQEIRRTPQEFVRQLISTEPKAVSRVKEAGSRAIRTGIETFAMSDAWVKIAAFQERTNTLTNFYKAEGITKTEGEVKREAADQIKDTNITYARTPAAVRAAERVGLTTFMPYFVSVPRALTYNAVQGAKDMMRAVDAKTMEGKMILGLSGAKRVAGVGLATYGAVTAMKAIAASVNGEDEEKAEELQKLMMTDARFSDSFLLGKDKDGIPLFARFSRTDPFGPVNDFLRIAMDDSASPAEKKKYIAEMFRDLLITNRVVVGAGQLGLDVLVDTQLKNKTTKIERVAPKTAEALKDWMIALPGIDYSDANSALEFMDSFVPGITDMFDPNNKTTQDAKSPDAMILSQLITYSGGRLDRADPSMAAYQAGQKVKAARDQGRKRQADGINAGNSVGVLQERFLEDAQLEYEAMIEAENVYEGMVNGMGMTAKQAGSVLKDDASLTASDIAGIRNGKLSLEAEEWIPKYSRIISKSSQENRGERSTSEVSKEEIKQYLSNMKALGYKVQE